MKTFLKPLTMAEEQYYLQQYQRGDMEAKNILIERNLRLVAHVVKKYQVHKEKLRQGNQFGKIIVKSPYQEITYTVVASPVRNSIWDSLPAFLKFSLAIGILFS